MFYSKSYEYILYIRLRSFSLHVTMFYDRNLWYLLKTSVFISLICDNFNKNLINNVFVVYELIYLAIEYFYNHFFNTLKSY